MGDVRSGAVSATASPPVPQPPLAEPQRPPDKDTAQAQLEAPGPVTAGRALTSPATQADTPNACFLCIKAKTPCDGKTPCSRCIRLNVAHMCLKPNSLLAKAGLPTVHHGNPESDALHNVFTPPASALGSDSDTIQRTAGGFRFNALTGQRAYPSQTTGTTAVARTGAEQPMASQLPSLGGTVPGVSAQVGVTSSQTSRPDPVYVLQELSSMRREHRRLINEVKLLRFQNERLERNLETAKQEAEAERLHQKATELRERQFFTSPNRCTYPVFVTGPLPSQGTESTRFNVSTAMLKEGTPTPDVYMPHSPESAPKQQVPGGDPKAQLPNPVVAAAVNAILSNKGIDFHNDAVVQRFQKAIEASETTAADGTTVDTDGTKTTTGVRVLSPEEQGYSPPQLAHITGESGLLEHESDRTAGMCNNGNGDCFGTERAIVSAAQFSPRFREVTEDERCQQLQELQRVQTGAANISDIRSQAMVVFDLRTNPPLVSEVTALFAHLLGYKPSELLHEPWYKLIDESLYDATMNNLNKCLRSNSNCSVVHQLYLRKDGALLESIDTHQFVTGIDGRPLYDIIVVKPVGFTTRLSEPGPQALVTATQRCPPDVSQNALAIPSTSHAPYSSRTTLQNTPQFITVDPGVFAMLSNRAQPQPQPQPQFSAVYQPQPQVAAAAVPDPQLCASGYPQPVFPKPSAVRRVRPSPVQVRPSTAPPAQRLRLSPAMVAQQSATEPSFLPLPSPSSMASTQSTPLQPCDPPELGTTATAAGAPEASVLGDDPAQVCFCSSEPLTATLPAPDDGTNADPLFATETGTPTSSLALPPPPTPTTGAEQLLPPLPPPQSQPLVGMDTTAAATAAGAAGLGAAEESEGTVKDDLGVAGDQGALGFSPLGTPTASGDMPGLLSPSSSFNTFLYPY